MLQINVFKFSLLFLLSFLTIASLRTLYAEEAKARPENADYISIYNNANYKEALKIISGKITSLYSTRTEQRIPSPDHIEIKKEEDRRKINDLFRKRKAKGFLIEDNDELFKLHLYAARCYFKTEEPETSLNNYFESLRYKSLEQQKDDIIFHEISQVYKSLNYKEAYTRSLETAYSLNPSNYEYSLELGKALSITKEKKKAIFHLKRYAESKGDDVEPDLFLTLGNLNEYTGQYLETIKYYKKYLTKKSEDGYINFALGYLAFKKTGDYKLALDSFEKSIKYLPEKELFRRYKAAEFEGDIYMQDLENEKAIKFYVETKKYHDKINADLQENNNKRVKLNAEIGRIKLNLKDQNPEDRYNSYQKEREEKGKIELANREMNYELGKLNAGRIRWNLAVLHERLDKLEEAIQYYNEAALYNYNPDEARNKITKLKLKIKRGY